MTTREGVADRNGGALATNAADGALWWQVERRLGMSHAAGLGRRRADAQGVAPPWRAS